MRFPLVGDIASTSVVRIDASSFISDAITLMLKNDHRNIIVIDNDVYRILTVIDILNIQASKIDLNISLNELNLQSLPTIDKDKNVLDTLEYLSASIEYICVVDKENKLYGLLTHTDITSNIDPDTLMDNFRLQDFLKLGRKMKWVNKDEKTSDLLNAMVTSVHDNVVVVEDKKPIGILTTKDVMRLIKYQEKLDLPISTYMSSPVDTISKNASVKEALEFVRKKHYKRVVVVDDEGRISGIITQKELISLTYSRWAILMKEYQNELTEINTMLKNQNIEYETMASTDSLTGLYNRNKFSQLYVSSYKAMIQRHNYMSMILVDIDLFKKVNDNYGHNAGDQVLIQISHALLRTLRNIDIVCRWGGEEFIILLPTAKLEQAEILAEKLRVYIEKADIDIVGHVSASFGVSQVREGEEMKDAISRADKALYLAKNSGRNCVKTELELSE